MRADEKRITYLRDHPEEDVMLDTDVPFIKSGLLVLNYTTVEGKRMHPFVTPSEQALKYLDAHGRLTPADRRTLKSLSSNPTSRIKWALTQPRTLN